MTNLRFEWEWEAAPPIRAPELRATFARLKIYVHDDCITLVEDRESGSSRRAIAVSLYPLAEWIAYNWWFLLADSRHAMRSMLDDYRYGAPLGVEKSREHHNIRNAGDGFMWPDLYILPEGSATHLVWRPDRSVPDGWPIRFLKYGSALVDSEELRQVLGSFVQSVIDRLSDCEVVNTRLVDEWEAIQSADREEKEYCIAAARLGLDPYSEAAKYENEILRAAGSLNEDLLGEFLDVADPERISADLNWVNSAQAEIDKMTGGVAAFEPGIVAEVAKKEPSILAESPWRAGYDAARSLRRALGIAVDDAFSVEEYVENRTVDSPESSLHAFGSGRDFRTSLILGRQQRYESKRFTLARALWHTLRRPDRQFLITSGHTMQHKAERAFAAELLVPAEGVSALVSSGIDSVSDDEIERIGQHFNVSPFVVKHQIDNQLVGG